MTMWKVIKELLFNQSTLSRTLGEIGLKRMINMAVHEKLVSFVLVAGGGRRSRGSEAVLTEILGRSTHLIFVDIDRLKMPHTRADLANIWPFKHGVFDLVISTWVVEHLMSPETFFREACRVLKNNGAFICGAPFIYQKHGSPGDWWRFTDTALSHMAYSAGFQKVEVRPVGGTPCVTCLSLLWPFLQIRFIGILLLILAWGLDSIVSVICRLTGKGRELVHAYPIHYIAYARK
jgi:SAM-dependent methyltransferase